MTWKQVKLTQFQQILEVENQKLDDTKKIAEIIKIIFGIEDPLSLEITEFQKYVDEIKFIGTPIPNTKLVTQYTINNTVYSFKGNVFEINMSQLIDWRNYCKKTPLNYAEILSVFVIPKNRKYNDGYNMEQTIEDIGNITIPDAMTMFNFFVSALQMSTNLLQDYLKHQVKKLKTLQPKQQKQIEKMLEMYRLALQNMISSRTV